MLMQNLNLYTAENLSSDKIETGRIVNEQEIPIIASVIITDEIWGRLDIIMNRYYGRLDVLHVVLDFNNISDVTNLKVGDVIELPNIDALNLNTQIGSTLEEMEVCGIHAHGYDNMTKEQQSIATIKKSTPTKTTANPKLKVTVTKVKADIPNGIITF